MGSIAAEAAPTGCLANLVYPVNQAPANLRCLPAVGEYPSIARKAVRAQKRLRQKYGKGYWRKRKGIACVKFENGLVAKAELHWYEATGIGKKEFKIKRLLG